MECGPWNCSPVTSATRTGGRPSGRRGRGVQVIAGLAEDLPVQVIHGDITGDNVVCAEWRRCPTG